MATTEVMGVHLCLTDPRRRFVDLPPARVINPAFAVAEALWVLSGSDDPWIFQYNRALARYADGGRLQGAYGPRMRRWRGGVDQLDQVRRLLGRDPDSRQGVIQLFDPERDTRGHRDMPCTLGYRFFLRGGRLHMHTTMRSQDLWLGFPYDVFTATLLQELLAGWLGVEVGECHHHVDSLHLYDRHQAGAARLPAAPEPSPPMPPVGVEWQRLPTLLAAVICGEVPPGTAGVWGAFAAVLASYRAWTGGDRDQARGTAAAIPGELGRALQRWYSRLATAAAPAATGSAR
jgi:thymidylate synthase